MLLLNIFRSLLNENQLALLKSWKTTTETNTHDFCLQNKLTADDYGRITIKTLQKIEAYFVAAQN